MWASKVVDSLFNERRVKKIILPPEQFRLVQSLEEKNKFGDLYIASLISNLLSPRESSRDSFSGNTQPQDSPQLALITSVSASVLRELAPVSQTNTSKSNHTPTILGLPLSPRSKSETKGLLSDSKRSNLGDQGNPDIPTILKDLAKFKAEVPPHPNLVKFYGVTFLLSQDKNREIQFITEYFHILPNPLTPTTTTEKEIEIEIPKTEKKSETNTTSQTTTITNTTTNKNQEIISSMSSTSTPTSTHILSTLPPLRLQNQNLLNSIELKKLISSPFQNNENISSSKTTPESIFSQSLSFSNQLPPLSSQYYAHLLPTFLRQPSKPSIDTLLSLAVQIALAISHLSSHGFVHKTLQAHNVLVTREYMTVQEERALRPPIPEDSPKLPIYPRKNRQRHHQQQQTSQNDNNNNNNNNSEQSENNNNNNSINNNHETSHSNSSSLYSNDDVNKNSNKIEIVREEEEEIEKVQDPNEIIEVFRVKVKDGEYGAASYSGGLNGTTIIPNCRWAAIETLTHGFMSPASDIWAFGVTLYEIFSYCKELPYKDWKGREVIKNVIAGHKLKRPDKCPPLVYEIMFSCWHKRMEDRVGWKLIIEYLSKMREEGLEEFEEIDWSQFTKLSSDELSTEDIFVSLEDLGIEPPPDETNDSEKNKKKSHHNHHYNHHNNHHKSNQKNNENKEEKKSQNHSSISETNQGNGSNNSQQQQQQQQQQSDDFYAFDDENSPLLG